MSHQVLAAAKKIKQSYNWQLFLRYLHLHYGLVCRTHTVDKLPIHMLTEQIDTLTYTVRIFKMLDVEHR